MWSDLVAENKPQVAHTNFDPEVAQASNPKPMIAFTPISDEGSILLVWTRIPNLEDYSPQPAIKIKRHANKFDEEEQVTRFEHHFLYIPKGVLLMLHQSVRLCRMALTM